MASSPTRRAGLIREAAARGCTTLDGFCMLVNQELISVRLWTGQAYAIAYPTSDHRAAELPVWLNRYNWHRPHGSLKSKPPISRLDLTLDNLLRLHS